MDDPSTIYIYYSIHIGKEYDTVFELIVESLSAETPSVVSGALLV